MEQITKAINELERAKRRLQQTHFIGCDEDNEIMENQVEALSLVITSLKGFEE